MNWICAAVFVGAVVAPTPAVAESRVGAEAALEYDSNVTLQASTQGQRDTIAANVFRGGLSYAAAKNSGKHSFSASFSGRTRLVTEVASESVAFGSLDGRYLRWTSQRRLALGVQANAAGVRGLFVDVGARSFRSLSAAALAVYTSKASALSLSLGPRDFVYYPAPKLSYRGIAATLTMDTPVWKNASGERAVTLAVNAGAETRGFDDQVLTLVCPVPMEQMVPADCLRGASQKRQDLARRFGTELTYSGEVVATIGYRALLIDSNSYAQSVIRHQVIAIATAPLTKRLFATAQVMGWFEQFPNGSLTSAANMTELVTIADEARSSVQLRIGYRLSPRLTLESRLNVWRSLAEEVDYRRQTASASLVWQ